MLKRKRNEGTSEIIPVIVINSPEVAPKDCVDVKKEEQTSPVCLRRNSISLPNLDELNVCKDQIQIAECFKQNADLSEDSDNANLEEILRKPLRNVRRKSVTTPRMLKPPGDPTDDECASNSPATSITSINSLASLLRERIQALPATLKNKKNANYKVKTFVALLFITIIVLVSCAYTLYNQKVLQKAYFEKVKFNNVKKLMKIFNNESVEIYQAKLAVNLNYDTVHACLPKDQKSDGSICMEWMNKARWYLNAYQPNRMVKCFNLIWIALAPDVEPTDCIDLSFPSSHWYGGGQNRENAWPLEKGNHSYFPFITGRVDKHEWGNVLKRYFISSKGVAIVIHEDTPLYVSIIDGVKKQLCLKAKYDDFAYVNHVTTTPQLNYSICVSTSMIQLHSNLIENTLWDGLKKEDVDVINSLLSEPLWEITSGFKTQLTQDIITNYTENVIALGFLKQGHVLINEYWQKYVGDFEVDLVRFPSLEESIKIMHRRGFRIVLSIQPYISTESANFAETVNRGLLVTERSSDRRIPALTRYKSLQSAGLLDATNNRTIPWLLNKLKHVTEKYQFDSFYLDLGLAYNMPHYYRCKQSLINPDQYKTVLVNNLQNDINLFGVNSAVERPRAPTFVSLPPFESSWADLRRVIPTILTYGINGYPFLIPGAVGGDFESAISNTVNASSELLPDKELYVRWLQLATFLPVIKYTHLPSTYGDEKVLGMAKILTSLRHAKVTPLLKKYARIALDTGLPIIRPLWMLESNDPSCHLVVDEFSIGDDIIVAPVLYYGARQREIYLPPGVWKDGIAGSLRKGSRWIHDYHVEENQVAFFEKMPDNTRF